MPMAQLIKSNRLIADTASVQTRWKMKYSLEAYSIDTIKRQSRAETRASIQYHWEN